jgi:chitodextrinase
MRSSLRRFGAVVGSVLIGVSGSLSGGAALFMPAVARAAGLAVDKQVATHQSNASSSISSPGLTTAAGGELVVAFVMSDGGSNTKQTFSGVTGGGLNWRLRQRSNTQYGTAEIWQAVAASRLNNAVIKATRAGGNYGGSMVVTAFSGASTTVDGATMAAGSATGAPTATLATTQPGSWVWGAGNDWSRAVARTVGANQTKADEYLQTNSGDSYWVQRQNAPNPGNSLTAVTINDTAPTDDMWNLALIEIVPAATDAVAPSMPTGVQATAVSPTAVNVSWTASADNIGVTGYLVTRGGTQVGTSTTTSYADTGLTGNTAYTYTVTAVDAAGNVSDPSDPVSVTTPAPDVTPPVISSVAVSGISQSGATVSWTTDEAATTQVEYGLTSSYGSSTTLVSSLSTAHSQALSGLNASMTYHYRVKSADGSGNVAVSADDVFATTAPAPDTTPPTVSVTAPAGGASVSGTVNVTANASDNMGVAGVQFQLDGANLGAEDTAGPYSVSWDTKTVANGAHVLSAVARDAAGNTAAATNVNVTVNNDLTAPTVAITSPAGGTNVNGTISVLASANDNVGVASVQFQLDGANLGAADTASPYSVQWDTTTAGNGGHTLTAIARDAAGNSTTSASVNVAVNNAGASDPSAVGQWGSVIAWPEVSIHAALTPSGKVLTFQGDFASGGQQYVYDPGSGVIKQVPNAAADLFCAGQAVLADGKVMVLGGTATSGGLGIKAVTAFDWTSENWQNMVNMNHARWYATGTTLGDGRVMSISGYNQNGADLVTIPEIYSPASNTWTDMAASATETLPIYPFMYQLPDGRVLAAGASEVATDTRVLNLQTQQWSVVDGRVIDGSSIANYAPGKFLKAGSAADSGNSGPSSNTAFTLDMNQPNPTWQPAAPMQYPRSFVNLTNLPDGTVLATGGETDKSGYSNANAVLPAELWNPATGTWTTMSAMSVPRLYHSVAVLLPDGRVFISGSGGDPGVPDQKSAQIFSPNYLFKGARPTITNVPQTVQYGGQTLVQTPDAAQITSVSLIRTGSVTHSFDQNARALSLPFTQVAGGLSVTMPASGNFAPPGYYLLSIVNANGVPSVSSFVRFPAPYEDSVAPSAPGTLNAAGGVGAVNLNWGAATDNVGVTGYDVYRSATPGFTPSAANKVGSTNGALSYTDAGLSAGTYYYQVTARDAVGNVSPPSNEASAAATTNTTPPSAPSNLAYTLNGAQVNLSWTAATDNVGVTGYQVLRDGAVIGTTAATSFVDGSTLPGTTYSYTVVARDAAGNVGPASNAVSVTTGTSAPLTLDATVASHAGPFATTISSAPLTTTGSNELIVAMFALDGPGPGTGQTLSGVTGGGLTWRLRQRVNTQGGSAEIWQAVAPAPVSGLVVTGTFGTGSYNGSVNLAAFTGADTATDGAVAGAQAVNGAPSLSLTPKRVGSMIWAVGNDYDNGIVRTVGAGQTKVDEYLSSTGDTYWVQRLTGVTTSLAPVTISDTAPTTDRWNFAAIEILPAP